MSNYIEVMAIVEGKTEQIFVDALLQPYLAEKMIFLCASQVKKLGSKGGDVHFSRVKMDLGAYLKQRNDTYVTTIIDYYGVKEWPGMERIRTNATPNEIANVLNTAAKTEIDSEFSAYQASRRYIPFMAIHEFEALLFSDERILAAELNVREAEVAAILTECGEPEAINNNPNTAPSKRLDALAPNGNFRKTTKGIEIAKKIGIDRMREKCPLFNGWITRFESIVAGSA